MRTFVLLQAIEFAHQHPYLNRTSGVTSTFLNPPRISVFALSDHYLRSLIDSSLDMSFITYHGASLSSVSNNYGIEFSSIIVTRDPYKRLKSATTNSSTLNRLTLSVRLVNLEKYFSIILYSVIISTYFINLDSSPRNPYFSFCT